MNTNCYEGVGALQESQTTYVNPLRQNNYTSQLIAGQDTAAGPYQVCVTYKLSFILLNIPRN